MSQDTAEKDALAPKEPNQILPLNAEDPQSDEELVAAFLEGDMSAYGTLFEKHRGPVFGAVYIKIGNVADVNEIVQDAFVQGMKRMDTLRDPKAFGGWIKVIAIRLAINRVTREKVMRQLPNEENLVPDDSGINSGLHIMLDAEQSQQVRTCMSSMKQLDRDTLHTFYFHGLSLKQMVIEFDATMGTIKRRLHVACNRFHEKYISYIDDSNGSPQSKHHLDDLPHAEQPEHPDHAAVSLGPLHDHLRSAVRSQQTESHRH